MMGCRRDRPQARADIASHRARYSTCTLRTSSTESLANAGLPSSPGFQIRGALQGKRFTGPPVWLAFCFAMRRADQRCTGPIDKAWCRPRELPDRACGAELIDRSMWHRRLERRSQPDARNLADLMLQAVERRGGATDLALQLHLQGLLLFGTVAQAQPDDASGSSSVLDGNGGCTLSAGSIRLNCAPIKRLVALNPGGHSMTCPSHFRLEEGLQSSDQPVISFARPCAKRQRPDAPQLLPMRRCR